MARLNESAALGESIETRESIYATLLYSLMAHILYGVNSDQLKDVLLGKTAKLLE